MFLPNHSTLSFHHSEATAASMKRAVLASSGANVPDLSDPLLTKNSERDCQRMVQRRGLTLPIEVQSIHHECELPSAGKLTTYHIRPQDWLRYWLETAPEILGGFSGDHSDNFHAFWKLYAQTHGTHKVFENHANHLQMVVPLMLHGDEGRAVKKTNYLVTSVESPLGSVRDSRVEAPCFLARCLARQFS